MPRLTYSLCCIGSHLWQLLLITWYSPRSYYVYNDEPTPLPFRLYNHKGCVSTILLQHLFGWIYGNGAARESEPISRTEDSYYWCVGGAFCPLNGLSYEFAFLISWTRWIESSITYVKTTYPLDLSIGPTRDISYFMSSVNDAFQTNIHL
jgi:hypothetical protein